LIITDNEVARHVRTSVARSNFLIAMTGFSDEIEKGIFDYTLEKPFKLGVLYSIIRSLGNKHVDCK
jgi:hypothetical protein